MLRLLLIFFAICVLLLSLAPVRRRLREMLRSRDVAALKQALLTAFGLYFLLSLVLTLYRYFGPD